MRIGIGNCCSRNISDCMLPYVIGCLLLIPAGPILAEQSVLQIRNAWIKSAAPGTNVNAGYVELYNSSG